MKQRFIALLLAVCIACTMLVMPASASSANSAVQAAVMLGGLTSEQAAGPDAALTRGQLAKLLAAFSSYRESAAAGNTSGALFTDVAGSDPLAAPIRIAVQQGWMSGYSDGSFRPSNTVTLEEACAAVLNLLVFHMLFAYMWPQVVLLDQPFRQTLANSVRCMLAFLPHALAASIIQILFWGLVILCMPLGILLMIVFGFWFTCELCCQIVSGDLERVFHIEEQIRAKYDEDLAAQKDGADDGSGAEAASGVWPPQKGTTGDGTEK